MYAFFEDDINRMLDVTLTEHGRKSGHTPLGKKGHAEGMPMIPGSLSTVYSGSCALEPLGGICRKHMETGRMSTAGSVGGVTREFGKRFWKPWWMTQILSG